MLSIISFVLLSSVFLSLQMKLMFCVYLFRTSCEVKNSV